MATYRLVRKSLSEISKQMDNISNQAAEKSKFQNFMSGLKDKAAPVFQKIGNAIGIGAKATGNFVATKAKDAWADMRTGGKAFVDSYKERQAQKKDDKTFEKMQKLNERLQARGFGDQMRHQDLKPASERIREAVETGLPKDSSILKERERLQKQLTNLDSILYDYGNQRISGKSHEEAVKSVEDKAATFWTGQRSLGYNGPNGMNFTTETFKSEGKLVAEKKEREARIEKAKSTLNVETEKDTSAESSKAAQFDEV